MTQEQALCLQPGDRVFAHQSSDHDPSDESIKVYDTVVTVKMVENFDGEIMIDVCECADSLYWDEVDFIEQTVIDDIDEYEAGCLSDLF